MTARRASRSPAPAGAQRPSRQLIENLLSAAVAAPSMHNSQPWRFRIRPDDAVELRADPARMLPASDPGGRAAHIACGAALLNLRIAAAATGWHARARLLPDPAQPLLLAEIRLGHGHEATPWERELSAAIAQRQTNREPFSNQPVPPGIRADLADAADAEGAVLHFPGHDETVRILRIIADTERKLLADPGYREELARWAGGYRDREGIPDRALGPRSPEGGEPVRDFGRHSHPTRYAWFEDRPQLAVLSVRSGQPADWLAAGQALERVWLTATSRGISVSPLTQALETAETWLIRDPHPGTGQPQMILRIGYGLPLSARSPRRPVADVIEEPEPGTDTC